MLDLVAPIYRTLIYDHLSIKSLVRLSETCKTINNDSNLKEFIMKKIISKFGYRISDRYWSFNYINYDKMNINMLSKIIVEFMNKTRNLDFNNIVNLSFEDKRYLRIMIPNELYLKLSTDEKIQIIHLLCDQLYRLYEYANQRGMKMTCYEYRCVEEFDLYPFNDSITYKLKSLFLKSNNIIKHKILESLNNISYSCKNDRFVNKTKLQNSTPNPKEFINSVCEYDISKLETIIEIGLFLEEYYYLYLTNFLESNIEYYINVNRSYEDKAYDDYPDVIDKILSNKNKIHPNKTNAQVLDRLIRSAIVRFDVNDIREANKKRRARMNGENSSDDSSDDSSEDFD
jgi:hypothetical protein